MQYYSKCTRAISLILIFFLTSCGGGGDSSSSCSTLKIAGGDSCSSGGTNVALILTSNGLECTGSYISTTSVLTAAHCFSDRPTSALVASKGNIRNGVQYFTHPLYDGTVSSSFDIAVIKVDAPISEAPIPLLISTMPTVGDEVVAYGYGTDENGREAIQRIQNEEIALKATTTTYAGYNSGTVSIISTGEGSTCQGDSGGPVLAKNAVGNYGIIGITRAGPDGCEAEKGRFSLLSSTQSNGAVEFLARIVPDAATN